MSIADPPVFEPGFERTPPNNIEAEQSVLGGMLLSKDAIADVVEILRSDDFYRPAHQLIYDIITALYGRGDPADAVTVFDELQKRGEVARVGGGAYLHTLTAVVPTAANAGYYARIVREQAILRRLIEAGTRIVSFGYGGQDEEVDDLVDRAQAEIYKVTERRTSEDYAPLADIMPGALDELEAIGGRSGQMVGVPTGFQDLDALTNGLHPGQMIVVAARPAIGKSTLGLDFARSAAIKHGMTTVVFSLEMSRNEITMRLLSAEARVALHSMRSGSMTDEDWARLARRMGEVAEAPLYIDDSPNMSMMEIRAKCRRLKQRHDLRFVVIDYLQLMSSPKKTESRQNEVSEISRAIKLLAKELEVPVIAISQLNRGPEQRTDKRPMVSDLRESGCLTADTRILRADTGAETSLGELLESGERDIPVWSLDERLRLIPQTMTHVFPSGVKEVFRLRLKSGREISATANHPFMTYGGWRPLGELHPGVRLAVPRHVPAPEQIEAWPENEVILLAHMIGDGSCLKRQPVRYASKDEACLAAVAHAAGHFGITVVRDEYEAARVTTLRLPAPYRLTHGKRNPIAAWMDSLGLFDRRSHEKYVPEPVFSLAKSQIALFLRHLWATDGCVWWDEKAGQARIYYASTSRRLIDDVARLLLRFNVMTRVKEIREGNYRPGYQLLIYGAENQLRFLDEIGVHGERSVQAERCSAALREMKGNTNLDTVPREVWEKVRSVLAEKGVTHREFSAELGTKFCGSTLWKHAPSREPLGRVATILDDAQLEMLATNDVFWDEIASIESQGEQPVYDATVLGTHNFVANGISVHNSIEQDADMVILLHREDAYERESPRAGEADLIVAKHRNGPTATVTVAFQGHYSRFVDMAPH
ncbi:replicative DNA helicase [Planomonospora parontospora subsp. parontospora]|uniref:Replicative DNA helicase n=3 Tax=Planomonospora parontospora TaxID=58119 RepID=A0AA37BEK5_9ACTN|nr:replicative DNA helicase [Planomonospora parontospora]GGK60281.1 replicative DNA helicase [Planomonospora parontospora]GII08791.1 replicative DNA helicase [Planomonospora parontospora subsp. parontospora]